MEEKTSGVSVRETLPGGFLKPGLAQVCMIYTAVILLFLLVGYRVQYREFYSGILITEFILIIGPPLLFLILGKFDLKKVLRLNRISILNLFIIACIMLMAIPLAGIFNLLNLWIVNSVFGKIVTSNIPVANNLTQLAVNILVIGGSAGICEELAFRGTIMRGFERFGQTKAILITALLFSLMHLDFQKIFGTFLLGALIGYIVYRTNSLYGGMMAHFTNNSAAVAVGFIGSKLTEFFKKSGVPVADAQKAGDIFSTFRNMPKAQLLATAFVWGFILLVFIAAFIALLYALIKSTEGVRKADDTGNSYREGQEDSWENGWEGGTVVLRGKESLAGLIWLVPAIGLIFTVYYVEAMRFRDLNNAFIQGFKKLLGL